MEGKMENSNNNDRNKNIQNFYTNILGITTSQNDVTIDFGYRTPKEAREGGKDLKEEDVRARISMSPSHAKHMLLVLKKMLDQYEKDIGEIPLAKNLKDEYTKYFKK